ncbi:MAG: hypothetical protein R3F39_15825 [Myxococcota bacterium]
MTAHERGPAPMTGGLLSRHGLTDAVCFGEGGERSAAEFVRDAEALRAALPEAEAGGLVLLVFAEDRYAFAVALAAAWTAGHGVILPADVRRESVGPLQKAPGVVGLFHDTKAGAAVQVERSLAAAKATETPASITPIAPPEGPAAVFAHSDGGQEVWTAAELMAAAEAIATAGGLDGHVLVSVSPLTAYGFIAGVLAPLVAGGAFSTAIAPAAGCAAPTVVTIPAHLKSARLLGPPCPVLAAARDASVVLLPAEIPPGPGASGLAVRPIAGLVRPDTSLMPARTKAIARALIGEAGAEDAAAWALPCAPGESPRLVAAAASATLSPATARSALEGAGILGVERVISVSEIPRDLLGRLDSVRFLRLFGLGPSGDALSTALAFSPATTSQKDGRTEATVAVQVPADYAYYAGHFPGYPIMAGVVQLHELVMPAIAVARPDLGELRSVTNVKFHKRILPGDTLELRLGWPGDDGLSVDFEIRRADRICAAGRLTYDAGAPAS